MNCRAHRPTGSRPVESRCYFVANKASKHTENEQRRDILDRVSHLAAAIFWVVRLVLLLWDRFAR